MNESNRCDFEPTEEEVQLWSDFYTGRTLGWTPEKRTAMLDHLMLLQRKRHDAAQQYWAQERAKELEELKARAKPTWREKLSLMFEGFKNPFGTIERRRTNNSEGICERSELCD